MVDFRPFRGLRYNPKVVGDLASVLCPPYDVIAPELQQSLYGLSLYNVVRLEEGEQLASDDATVNRYTRAAALFDQFSQLFNRAVGEPDRLYQVSVLFPIYPFPGDVDHDYI